MSESTAMSEYSSQYLAKKAMFSFLGNTFRLYSPDGQLQFFVKQKAFKLKEEINVFRDEKQKEKRLTIKARSWGDFSGTYDITDAVSDVLLGSARRKGLTSSFLRDEWVLLDADGDEFGGVVEQGGIFATLRKYVKMLKMIPQKYEIRIDGHPVGSIKQRFNPFQLGYDCDFSHEALDPRLGVGVAVLLLAIEGGKDQ